MLNMDFSKRVVIDTASQPWADSPASGVRRKPLEREARESGHVTSIVEYLPGASFSQHAHPHGEEIFVLEGVFSDETGDYGAGTYLRNPPGSRHTPFSEQGCIILVKLNQFAEDDSQFVRIDTTQSTWDKCGEKLEVMVLHKHANEQVALIRWAGADRYHSHGHFGGEEIFVLEGELKDDLGTYPAGTWTRSPHGSQHEPYVSGATTLWFKSGHLPEAQ